MNRWRQELSSRLPCAIVLNDIAWRCKEATVKIQHLVLDDDVHKALKARKKTIGITVKEIGNSALRAALSMPTLEELIVEKLVETGKITRNDYDQAVTAADKAIKTAHKKAAEMVAKGREGQTRIVGSWEGREIYRRPDGELQVFDQWAHDAKKVATPMLVHEKSHVWATVLAGKVHVQFETEDKILGPHDTLHIAPGTPHSTTPLTKSTRALFVFAPAIELDDKK